MPGENAPHQPSANAISTPTVSTLQASVTDDTLFLFHLAKVNYDDSRSTFQGPGRPGGRALDEFARKLIADGARAKELGPLL